MKTLARVFLVLLGIYISLGLTFDALVGYFQPQSVETLVLQTRGDDCQWIDTVLTARDNGEELWVESGHWFRGWYNRLLKNPHVYVTRHDKHSRYQAVPVNTDEMVDSMTRLMGKGQGMDYWIGRTLLLYAPIKPVRLDPGHSSGDICEAGDKGTS